MRRSSERQASCQHPQMPRSHQSLIPIQPIRYGTTLKPLIPTYWRPFRELHSVSRTRILARCFFLARTVSQWYVDFVSRRITKLTTSGTRRPSVVGKDEAHAIFASSLTSPCAVWLVWIKPSSSTCRLNSSLAHLRGPKMEDAKRDSRS